MNIFIPSYIGAWYIAKSTGSLIQGTPNLSTELIIIIQPSWTIQTLKQVKYEIRTLWTKYFS